MWRNGPAAAAGLALHSGTAATKTTVSHPHSPNLGRARCLLAWALLGAAPAGAGPLGEQLSFGGNLSVTTDYIYRGVSESNDHGALQGDLHLATRDGTFTGVWGSTRDSQLDPGGSYDVELYLGHRFALGDSWSTTLSARGHYFGGGVFEPSADYQEVAATLMYQDRWALSLTAVPNAVRYWFYLRLRRSPAWVADTTGQWLIAPGLYVTGGAGYYYSMGTGPGIEATASYGYGNVGLAYEWRRWRLDVGYFLTQADAAKLFPYPIADHRVAGTITWRF